MSGADSTTEVTPTGRSEDHSLSIDTDSERASDRPVRPSLQSCLPLRRNGRNLARGERFLRNPWNPCLRDQRAPAGARGDPATPAGGSNVCNFFQTTFEEKDRRVILGTEQRRHETPYFKGSSFLSLAHSQSNAGTLANCANSSAVIPV